MFNLTVQKMHAISKVCAKCCHNYHMNAWVITKNWFNSDLEFWSPKSNHYIPTCHSWNMAFSGLWQMDRHDTSCHGCGGLCRGIIRIKSQEHNDIFLPWVPSIRFGVILICGNEVDFSLHEVGESSLCLPLNVQLHNKNVNISLFSLVKKSKRIIYHREREKLW